MMEITWSTACRLKLKRARYGNNYSRIVKQIEKRYAYHKRAPDIFDNGSYLIPRDKSNNYLTPPALRTLLNPFSPPTNPLVW